MTVRACVPARACVSSRVMIWVLNKHTLGVMMNYACGNNASYNTSKKYENSATIYTKMTNKMQLCRIIYYSLAAVHVSSDIFSHHQEHLCYSFWYYTRMSLPVGTLIMGVFEL
jgi:hypothetical protein